MSVCILIDIGPLSSDIHGPCDEIAALYMACIVKLTASHSAFILRYKSIQITSILRDLELM